MSMVPHSHCFDLVSNSRWGWGQGWLHGAWDLCSCVGLLIWTGCMFGLMLFCCSLEIHFALGPANYLASPGWDGQFHIDLDSTLLDSLLLNAYNLAFSPRLLQNYRHQWVCSISWRTWVAWKGGEANTPLFNQCRTEPMEKCSCIPFFKGHSTSWW